jgi:hypothetical protein
MVTVGTLIPVMTAPGGSAGVFLFNRADVLGLSEAVA